VQPAAFIELLAGEYQSAERLLREAREILADVGERGYLSTVSALLARALVMQERYEEAEVFADEARHVGAEDDVMTQLYWRGAKAHVLAARGERDEAARLAAEIVGLAPAQDDFDAAVNLVDIADFLEPGPRGAALEHALAGASAKGNVVTAEQARAKLAALP
jgi:tetratricopeptide (TPR) repeat protein